MRKVLVGLILLAGLMVFVALALLVILRELLAHVFLYSPYVIASFVFLAAVSRVWVGIARIRRGQVTGQQRVWHKNYDVLLGLALMFVAIGIAAGWPLLLQQVFLWLEGILIVLTIMCFLLTTRALFYRFMDRIRNTPQGEGQKRQLEGEDEATLPHQTSRPRPQPKEAREEEQGLMER